MKTLKKIGLFLLTVFYSIAEGFGDGVDDSFDD